MAVLAIFRYDVKPGRTADFIEKLQKAAGRNLTVRRCRKVCGFFAARCLGRIRLD